MAERAGLENPGGLPSLSIPVRPSSFYRARPDRRRARETPSRTTNVPRVAPFWSRSQIGPSADMCTRIVQDPTICSGRPTIRGTRILVANVVGMAAGGYTIEQIRQAYPELSAEDVTAALAYGDGEQ